MYTVKLYIILYELHTKALRVNSLQDTYMHVRMYLHTCTGAVVWVVLPGRGSRQ